LIPNNLSLGDVIQVLRSLLSQGVSVRDPAAFWKRWRSIDAPSKIRRSRRTSCVSVMRVTSAPDSVVKTGV
jgi:hypothetical protein